MNPPPPAPTPRTSKEIRDQLREALAEADKRPIDALPLPHWIDSRTELARVLVLLFNNAESLLADADDLATTASRLAVAEERVKELEATLSAPQGDLTGTEQVSVVLESEETGEIPESFNQAILELAQSQLAAERRKVAELEQIKVILADANAVRINMLRGTIAWTPETLRHVLGIGDIEGERDALARQAEAQKEALEHARDAMSQIHAATEVARQRAAQTCGAHDEFEQLSTDLMLLGSALDHCDAALTPPAAPPAAEPKGEQS